MVGPLMVRNFLLSVSNFLPEMTFPEFRFI